VGNKLEVFKEIPTENTASTNNNTVLIRFGAEMLSALADPLTAAKTVAMLVLGLGSFGLGVLPLKLTARWGGCNKDPQPTHAGHSHAGHVAAGSSTVVSLMLCFGGGVLLFTTLLHLQPEVRDAVEKLQRTGQLPSGLGAENLGDLIFCAGFFMVFIVDEIVHSMLDHRSTANETLRRTMSLRRRAVSIPRASLTGSPGAGGCGEADGSGNEAVSTGERYRSLEDGGGPRANKMSDGDRTESQAEKVHGGGENSFRGLFAVLALSFHEVFEGLAIGLEERVDHTWYLFAAVATHKLIIAFCIGLELAWSKTQRSVLVTYVATFAAVTPLGIAAGMVLVQNAGAGTVDGTPGRVAVVLQGLAAGTLLYVVFFEVLDRHKQSGFLHLLSIIFGFCVLFVLQLISEYTRPTIEIST